MATDSTTKLVVGFGAIVLIAACGAGACLSRGTGQPEPRQPAIEYPDCDKDDRSPNWEVADCGPSPTPAAKRSTAPAVKPSPRPTRRR